MLQVLANLITNAIKFTPGGGTIRVRVERVGEELAFAVSDTGCGIPEALLESVFDRFWQAGENDRRGVGLGLYITRCIVEAHGGTIRAESVVGAGSVFRFTLSPRPSAA
jgi:signal transduction histidine kinase